MTPIVLGLEHFLDDVARMRGKKPKWYWRITWAGVTPLYMMVCCYRYERLEMFWLAEWHSFQILFILALIYAEAPPVSYTGIHIGWFLSSMPMLSIVGFGICIPYRRHVPEENGKQVFRFFIMPTLTSFVRRLRLKGSRC